MKPSLRSHIYNAVVQCRRLLESDFSRQLEGTYGVHTDGTFEPLDGLTHLDAVGRADRQAIEAAIRHEEVAGATRQEAVERYVRESAFTFLNRLAALKLMEHPSRALIQPSVGAGDQSKGFQQFSLLSPEAMRAQPGGGYRLYLELLFDDLSQTLGVLFDRTLPTSILFPTQPCLREVLALLNDPAYPAVPAGGAGLAQRPGTGDGVGRGRDHRLDLPVFHPDRTARGSPQGLQRAAHQLRTRLPQPVLHAALRGGLPGR